MQTAFKEWAVICRALATARQTVILRKGGIVEERGEFRPEYPEFLLFPTYLHQSPESVVPEARNWLAETMASEPKAGTVTLSHWCQVAQAIRVCSLDAVQRLEGYHIWSSEIVLERFHRWQESIYALVVRTYCLPQPVTLPLAEDYSGCKSWVELKYDVQTAGSTPVLHDAQFGDRLAQVRAILGGG